MQLLVTFLSMSRAQIADPCNPDRSDAEPDTSPIPISVTPGSGASAAEMKTEEIMRIAAVRAAGQTGFMRCSVCKDEVPWSR
jgi:hypothetical protein